MIEKQIARQKVILSRFKGKLGKMIKDVDGRFNDSSNSPLTRQVLLYWNYELVENVFFLIYKNELLSVTQRFTQINSQKKQTKQNNNNNNNNNNKNQTGVKEKAAEYYEDNQEKSIERKFTKSVQKLIRRKKKKVK